MLARGWLTVARLEGEADDVENEHYDFCSTECLAAWAADSEPVAAAILDEDDDDASA